jgi:hypothetical protein
VKLLNFDLNVADPMRWLIAVELVRIIGCGQVNKVNVEEEA